ncbi:hypothetical protein TrVE_jg11976 [Triparma verrucosa]|uniref:Uncharacterized protein n=1 Tax=Triparma verrucosa TaxID=1606542 RepID=A0A9W7C461_9STRA|nr:hypothetical protein TrVE_jg11976 [Triparma verrucosa]
MNLSKIFLVLVMAVPFVALGYLIFLVKAYQGVDLDTTKYGTCMINIGGAGEGSNVNRKRQQLTIMNF